MCHKNGLLNTRLSSVHYSTTERNAAHETLVNCNDCSKSKRKRCRKSMQKENHGTDSNKKSISKRTRERFEHKPLAQPYVPKPNHSPNHGEHWQLLSSKTSFTFEATGKKIHGRKQYKIIPIRFGKTADRLRDAIHP